MTRTQRHWKPARLAEQAAQYRQLGMDELAGKLEAHLKHSGRCKVCGRLLTDPTSVERGVGPDCWAKPR